MQRQAAGARTPDELSMQLEDALIVRDVSGLAELFETHAVLSAHDSDVDLCGNEEIAEFVAAHWAADRGYLAEVRRVVQAGDTAAIVVDWCLTGRGPFAGADERGRGVDVLRRGNDGAWRYLISLLRVCEGSRGDMTGHHGNWERR